MKKTKGIKLLSVLVSFILVFTALPQISFANAADAASKQEPEVYQIELAPPTATPTSELGKTGEPGSPTPTPVESGEPESPTPTPVESDEPESPMLEPSDPPLDEGFMAFGAMELQAMLTPVPARLTIHANDSKGNPLAGVSFSMYGGQYGGSINTVGTSDSNGILALDLTPGTYHITASYAATKATQRDLVLGADGLTVNFATHEARVKVQTSAGEPLANIGLSYNASSSYPTFGKTDETGVAVKELFAGTYGMQASYKGTNSGYIPVDITADGVDHTFQTTRVQFHYAGKIDYLGSNSSYYNLSDGKQSGEMFPGTYNFFFGGSVNPQFINTIGIGDSAFERNVALVTLKSSDGKGLAGGSVSYYAGGWVFGAATTDASGVAVLLLPGSSSATSVSMNYRGGTQQINQNMSANPRYAFTTSKVTVRLIDSKGSPLAGGASYYGGEWRNFGDEAPGQANGTMEMLPVTYSFAVSYQGGRQQKDNIDVGATPVVVFQTTQVTLRLLDSTGSPLAGSASYYGGEWRSFGDEAPGQTNGTMEMLPATYSFGVSYNGAYQQMDGVDVGINPVVVFQTGLVTIHYAGGALSYYTGGGGWKTYAGPFEQLPVRTLLQFSKTGWPTQQVYITPEAGKAYEKTAACIRLISSAGAGIAGGEVTRYIGAWANLGATGADGVHLALLDGNQTGSVTFGMTYGGGYTQKTQTLASDSHVLFQTGAVTVRLISSKGAPLAGAAEYYGGNSWRTFADGATSSAMEMLPGTYSFAVNYMGGRQQKSNVSIAEGGEVVFQTKEVAVRLLDSKGNPLGGGAQYYAGSWRTFADGTTSSTMEMLPVIYSFAVNYKGARQQKDNVNIADTSEVVFQTVQVSVKLLDSAGNALDGGAQYYVNGWQDFGDETPGRTNGTMEMLPVRYSFAVSYKGALQQKDGVDVAADPVVIFRTVKVTVKLYDGAGNPLTGSAQYYANGWRDFGDETPGQANGTMQMLPAEYTFAVSYGGIREQKQANVGGDPVVVFGTEPLPSSPPEPTGGRVLPPDDEDDDPADEQDDNGQDANGNNNNNNNNNNNTNGNNQLDAAGRTVSAEGVIRVQDQPSAGSLNVQTLETISDAVVPLSGVVHSAGDGASRGRISPLWWLTSVPAALLIWCILILLLKRREDEEDKRRAHHRT